MRTCGSAMRRTVTVSPAPARAKPRMSKPTAALPAEAGAKAVAWMVARMVSSPTEIAVKPSRSAASSPP